MIKRAVSEHNEQGAGAACCGFPLGPPLFFHHTHLVPTMHTITNNTRIIRPAAPTRGAAIRNSILSLGACAAVLLSTPLALASPDIDTNRDAAMEKNTNYWGGLAGKLGRPQSDPNLSFCTRYTPIHSVGCMLLVAGFGPKPEVEEAVARGREAGQNFLSGMEETSESSRVLGDDPARLPAC